MPNMTIVIDAELYEKMKKLSFINWSAVTRIIFRELAESLDDMTVKEAEKKVLSLLLEVLT